MSAVASFLSTGFDALLQISQRTIFLAVQQLLLLLRFRRQLLFVTFALVFNLNWFRLHLLQLEKAKLDIAVELNHQETVTSSKTLVNFPLAHARLHYWEPRQLTWDNILCTVLFLKRRNFSRNFSKLLKDTLRIIKDGETDIMQA